MRPVFLIGFCLLTLKSGLVGQTLEEALVWSRQELETARAELNEVRDSIIEEKLPLARELREVKEALLKQREAMRVLEASREIGEIDLASLKSKSQEGEGIANHFRNQGARFRQEFISDLVTGEFESYQARLSALGTPYREENDLLVLAQEQWEFLEMSLDRIDNALGGSRFEVSGVSKEGVLEKGEAVSFGPLVFFQSKTSTAAGNLLANFGLEPEIQTLGAEHLKGVAKLFDEGSAYVPVDPTLGQATLIYDDPVTIAEHLARGGFWMIPIAGFGLCASIICLFKWIALRRMRIPVFKEFLKLEHTPSNEWKSDIHRDTRDLLEKIVAANAEDEDLRAAELDVAYQEFRFKLNRWLPVVSLTAGVAPLLGLLGTVTGMIKTFQLISIFGAGDAKLLSSGISEALITTEFGLVVAIPALVFHAFLQRRVKKLLVQCAGLFEQLSRKEAV